MQIPTVVCDALVVVPGTVDETTEVVLLVRTVVVGTPHVVTGVEDVIGVLKG